MKNLKLLSCILFLSFIFSCKTIKEQKSLCVNLNYTDFQTEIDGKDTRLYILKSSGNVQVAITNYGGRIVSICTPDKNGNMADIVLGFNSIDEYLNAAESYHGALIGRFGNRIARGMFELNDSVYSLPLNNGPNHLHGGPEGFHNQVWDVDESTDSSLTLTYFSPDGEMGYPGNLKVVVKYILNSNDGLEIHYYAESDQKTVINLTSHPFFNLGGEGSGTVNDHVLTIYADSIVPVDSSLIPTGNLMAVENTPFDFRTGKPIAEGLENEGENIQLVRAGGFDHNFVLNKPENDMMTLAASVFDPETGRKMEVFTEEPGIQLYGGNFLNGSDKGNSAKPYNYREAFCLETQHFPDSPNQPSFPSTVLAPGETFTSTTVYTFGIQ